MVCYYICKAYSRKDRRVKSSHNSKVTERSTKAQKETEKLKKSPVSTTVK